MKESYWNGYFRFLVCSLYVDEIWYICGYFVSEQFIISNSVWSFFFRNKEMKWLKVIFNQIYELSSNKWNNLIVQSRYCNSIVSCVTFYSFFRVNLWHDWFVLHLYKRFPCRWAVCSKKEPYFSGLQFNVKEMPIFQVVY